MYLRAAPNVFYNALVPVSPQGCMIAVYQEYKLIEKGGLPPDERCWYCYFWVVVFCCICTVIVVVVFLI